MHIMVTGGAGYIGSHATLRLLELGHTVTVVDDLSNGWQATIDTLKEQGDFTFIKCRCGDYEKMRDVMSSTQVELVMHFAAFASVDESVREPLRYYENNTGNSLSLLRAMMDVGVNKIVFSSTCATYGLPSPQQMPLVETCPQSPISPYGWSKLWFEQALEQCAKANSEFSCTALRYFNVAGCDPQGRIGEHHVPETHLIPICLEVAAGKREQIKIFGTDYATPDGTCIRDYVHVEDLISAHLLAMDHLQPGSMQKFNVGIGQGHSVMEVIDSCRRVTGHPIPAVTEQRRPGDPDMLYNDPTLIRKTFGWKPVYENLDAIVETAWNEMNQ
ncbi:MAG: UDP-glucose 4-epimerase GalE [Phycisphaerales bacterium]|nr:UDP-glucose 4-epimerase GalE [Phycisphaerales bacterium]